MSRRRAQKKVPSSPVPQGLPAVEIAGEVFPAHILAIHHSIAERMGKGFLVCDNCSRVQNLTVEQTEQYLRTGFPVCCEGTLHGGTMRYCRAEERRRG
jgi:hypothetical protein